MAADHDTRNTVLSMLTDTLDKGGLSHIVLKRYEGTIGVPEMAFARNLYSGTLERLVFLDHFIGKFSNTPMRKMKPVIRNILRLSAYQLFFMDSVPDRAALSEAQRLCEKRGFKNLKGFVNGVLRAISRNKDMEVPAHVACSAPKWMYEKIVSEYGEKDAAVIFGDSLKANSATSIRLVTGAAGKSRDDIIADLENDGCEVRGILGFEKGLYITFDKQLKELKAFNEGLIFPQDISSMLVAECLNGKPLPEEPLIVDVCAAPGGKSICLADNNRNAQIIAMDVSEEKTGLIKENINRLKIENIKPLVNDALTPLKEYEGLADVVVCDLPCSGLGVIRRKPDIKARLKPDDIESLAGLQRDILARSVSYLKKGGYLIYSTCTVTKEENGDNADWIENSLGLRPEKIDTATFAELLNDRQRQTAEAGRLQLLNGMNGTDGFFISLFKKD